MKINPLLCIDFYKVGHFKQYPEGTTEIYSNFTARSSKLAPVIQETFDDQVVFFGLQYFLKSFLIDAWNNEFFRKPKDEIIEEYKDLIAKSLYLNPCSVETSHIEALHDLQYLPLKIKALEEGARVPIGVPMVTVVNTHPDFYWLTNYIETVMSSYLWKPITVATLAFEYKRLLKTYSKITGSPYNFIQFQAHDFSFRGMSGLEDAALSGLAHLTCFSGTDTIPAIELAEEYYHASGGIVGMSVPATEHSVMCIGMESGELDTFRRLIHDLYPTGIVSIVSDSWDFWKVVTEYLPILKEEILNRDGKVVIRPDSGDPVKIICGDPNFDIGTPENKGAVQCLWETFGGIETDLGYKVLDSHIGLIYGDSITLNRAHEILEKLKQKGFASCNIVFGVGSYTYQYVTRDSFGFAMKATSGVVNGERRDIYKNPKTDSGVKKSARGLLRVEYNTELKRYVAYDQQSSELEQTSALRIVFVDGKLTRDLLLPTIRNKIASQLEDL